MDIKKYIKSIIKYLNFPTLIQITNIIMLIYFLTHGNFWSDIYGYFVYAFPFLASVFMLIHIKKYEQFFSRDILMVLYIPIHLGIVSLGIAAVCVALSGL